MEVDWVGAASLVYGRFIEENLTEHRFGAPECEACGSEMRIRELRTLSHDTDFR